MGKSFGRIEGCKLIILSSNSKVFQIIDIIVADIPYAYGLILSRDWSEKLHGYFSTHWSHLWLPYNEKPNQIRVNREKHMKHNVTDLDGENEPVDLLITLLGITLLILILEILMCRFLLSNLWIKAQRLQISLR
jgi:hypothetical protein